MKTKLLLLFLVLISANAFAQYTSIPDPKFESELIELKYDDVPDGKVLTANINTIDFLHVTSSGISDLTGIQDFTALKTLYIYVNNIATLDLSKNINLTLLDCQSNKLTHLDVSKNTALTTLNCNNNLLTTLDISKNTSLTQLDCGYNKLTALDISKNPELFKLYCHNNSLNSLNLKNGNNTKLSTREFRFNLFLSCISVDDPVYANTNWSNNKDLATIYSAYDCSTITQIPDTKFEDKLIALGIDTDGKNGLVLNASITALTTLDISNSSITDLTGLENFTSLQTLNCSNNLLPRIDISKNTVLTSLDCSNNASLTCIQVADINTAKTNITTTQETKDKFNLDCRPYTLIPDPTFENRLIVLKYDDVADGKVETKKISSIEYLNIRNAGITDLTGIEDFAALKSLDCGYNKLTTLNLSNNTALKTLHCNDNKLTSLDISKNLALYELYVTNNSLTSLDISKNLTLYELSVTNNALTSLNTTNNTALSRLSCDNNQIVSLDLSKNTSLTRIHCSDNQLTSLNLKNGKNTNIGTLTFSNNPLLTCTIVDDVAYAKEKWSNQSNTLNNTFSVFECSTVTPIPDANFEDKLIALGIDTDGKNGVVFNSSITALTSLDISNSSIADVTGLEGFTALTTLNCSNNTLSAINISKNTALTTLDCSDNATLTCIQVADINAAKTNITTTQEAKDKFSLDCKAYTLIPDTKFEGTLISLGYDTTVDGKVETKNISGIKSLELPWYNDITDLTGIQDFTSLTYLKIYSLNITSLDVSKNINLTYLNCSSNELTSLDLSKNINLTELNCAENKLTNLVLGQNDKLKILNYSYNELSNMDLSALTGLTSLSCYSNKIEKLDVSKNINLTSIGCSDNAFSSLDISKNINLTALYCENSKLNTINLINNTKLNWFYCRNNPRLSCITVKDVALANTNWSEFKDKTTVFTTYDCAEITSIPDAAFEDKLIALGIDTDGKNNWVLNSSISTVTSLDVSNSAINDLTGLQNFTDLETLNCSANSIKTLDLSKNSALKTLNCSNNTLLTCIQVADVNLATTNWTTTKDASANFSLDCRTFTLIPDVNFETKLISFGIDDIADGKVETKNIVNIENLNVSNSQISDLTGIQDFEKLTDLNCTANTLTNLDVSKNINLNTLSCSNNNLTNLDVSKNINLKTLYCPWNQIISLDLSKNPLLTELTCYGNNLTSLNLKNGKNTFLNSLSISSNRDLNCITVDDVAYANTNWSDEKNSTAAFTTYDCNAFTLISDTNFEDKLIALGVDTDGKNGVVANSSIEKITQLDISNSSITNLQGIEGFKALTELNCSNNALTLLDLNKNTSLTKIESQSNQITDLEIENCVSLTHLNLASNKLDSYFDTNDLKALTWLSVSNNSITSLSIYQNTELVSLFCNDNKITSLSTYYTQKLKELNCANNQITNLDISDLTALESLNAATNKIEYIDLSESTALKSLNISGNNISQLSLSKNKALSNLNCSANNLQKLKFVENIALTKLDCSDNELLTELNLKNGNNQKLDASAINFKNTPNLTCIQVDDKAYSDTNWSSSKDATATFNTQCEITVPSNNFTVEARGETCPGENNGELTIYTNEDYPFVATINGKSTNSSDSKVIIPQLAPGNYTLTITMTDWAFEQVFNFTIPKAKSITGKSNVTTKKVNVEISQGTAPYTVYMNGIEQFETSEPNFTVTAKRSGLLEVKTAKSCEGIFSKEITGTDIVLSAYPNPTQGSFAIELPTSKSEVVIELNTLEGRSISNRKYTLENGTALLTLENQPNGVYIAKIYLDTIETIKIIKN